MFDNVVALFVSFTTGLLIGMFYFLGLWWTVNRLPTVRFAGLFAISSFGLRAGVTLAGFYLVMQGQWQNLLMCLAGFTLARLWLVRKMQLKLIKD
jgi:F1F0 ATPase subunit 2